MRNRDLNSWLAIATLGTVACSAPGSNSVLIGSMHPPIVAFSPSSQSVGDQATVRFSGDLAPGDFKVYAMHGAPMIELARNPLDPTLPRTPIVEVASFSIVAVGIKEHKISFQLGRVLGTDQYGSPFTVTNPIDLSILLHGTSQGTAVTFGWPMNESHRYFD